ncbi:NEDD4 family-interacting protein 1-like isoform X3 [Mobula hypostoma]|uniref:NEDD4 family-interacting protein 1-like isoform X3 n=1 Tax=Mobula hypostoma TaxID=723540 RepID=UPI002FC3B786
MDFNGKPIIFCEYEDDFTLGDGYDEGNQLILGNDGMFLLTFSRRYGAISGFGLSLIKWILIVRFSDYFFGYFEGKLWLWWSFLAVGILLFTNGFINYAKARKVASKIASLKKSKFLFIF